MTTQKTLFGAFAWVLVATTLAAITLQPVPASAHTKDAQMACVVKTADGSTATFA